ncbi:MAG: transcription elongation factor GreA [Spirochaetia bacterium]|nr:transcription elongation factor GreA [Spirochaetia bacterium]
MAESSIAKKLQEMLNEEKWTRATLGAYTVAQLKELDAIFAEAAAARVLDEVKEVCEEHLSHAKNSVIALYLTGIIALSRQQLDDSNMLALINVFTENKKWPIVEYACLRILDHGEDRMALAKLAECYQADDRIDELHAVWERYVRVDFEEADIVRLLAEKREKDGDLEAAVDWYRKALHRYINRGQYAAVKEIWAKLLEKSPDDIDFFLHVQRKIAKGIGEEKAAALLMDLYKVYRDREAWETALDILKTVIAYDDRNQSLRKELIDCYKGKYSGHSHLEDYIRLSNLAQGYRAIHEAMADFEKHIAFDVGNFVYHRTWNIGRIADISGDEIVIDFAKKRGHRMSLKMAIESLSTLSREHIWVLKAIWSKDKLREKIKGDIPWALKTIIKSFDNRTDLKHVKAELVPSVLTPGEWTGWSTQARGFLKKDSLFGNATDSIDVFVVRDRPLSFEEKVYNQFKAEKSFFARVAFVRDFIANGDPDNEYFAEMIGFFTGYLRSTGQVNELVMSSYLFLKELSALKGQQHLKNTLTVGFAELYKGIDDVITVHESIKDSTLRKAFLVDVKNVIPDWSDVYIKIFPYSLAQWMLDTLMAEGHVEKLKQMVVAIVENYRDHREAFIWVIKNLWEEPWVKELGLSYEKILITLVHILDITYKEIENHRDTTENRKINRQVHNLLFKDEALDKYLLESGHDTIERVYTLLDDVKDLDPAIKLRIRKRIVEKFPDFKVAGDEEKAVVSRGLMVTSDKYTEKQKLLSQILDVEVPANQREIAYALSLGDLRENAEYKAAKEKQDELNAKVAKLKNEIERAQIFDRSTASASKIGFGTQTILRNELTGEDELYVILGPWESDPAENVISYLSPLGKKLLNHKAGDKLSFVIHERTFKYVVKSVAVAKI